MQNIFTSAISDSNFATRCACFFVVSPLMNHVAGGACITLLPIITEAWLILLAPLTFTCKVIALPK